MSFTLILQTLYSATLRPPCIHSFLIFHSLFLSCPSSLAPILQFSWSSSQKPTYLWPMVLGFLVGYLSLLPLSCPLTPDSRECCFKIPLRPVQSKILSVRAYTGPALPLSTLPHTQAPPGVPQEAHGRRTPLMRDPAEELPLGAMKATSGHSMAQELDFQGATRAWLVLCTHP